MKLKYCEILSYKIKINFNFIFFSFYIEISSISLKGKLDGGSETSLRSMPYLISIRKDGRHKCVGNIIRDAVALAVARCIYKAKKSIFKKLNRYSVQVGVFEDNLGSIILPIIEVDYNKAFKPHTKISVGNIGLVLVSSFK